MATTRTYLTTVLLVLVFTVGGLSGLITGIIIPSAPTDSITVMTYNIYQAYTPDGRVSLADLRDTIRSVDPDILGLQECDSNRVSSMNIDTVMWLSRELHMYSYFGPPTSKEIIGVSLLSKYPIKNATYYLLPYEELPRVLIHAVIVIGSVELNVFVVHLGLSYTDRTTQAAKVMEYVNAVPSPKILIGDFNTLPTGHPEPGSEDPDDTIYHDISQYLNDTWTASGHGLDAPEGYTWPSDNPFERIDYIWVSPDISVISCTVLTDAKGSDHLPVVAEVRLPTP